MDRHWRALIEPLGPRLLRAAVRVAATKRTRMPWLEASEVVHARVATLPEPATSRYARVEVSDRVLGDAPAPGEGPADDQFEEGIPLPATARDRLRGEVGAAADALRVHDGEDADRIAAAQGADAVAAGRDVYFRRGRYRPHEREGFALLAHEATHVAEATAPNAAWRSRLLPDVAAEESAAVAVERTTRQPFAQGRADGRRGPAARPRRIGPVASAPAAAAATPAARPMTAAVERSFEPPTAPTFDMEALRQSLARDLLRQIRFELERGG